MYRIILTVCTILAMIVSYLTQHLCHGVYIMLVGFISSLILCVPSWPYLNRHQLKWLNYVPQNTNDKKK